MPRQRMQGRAVARSGANRYSQMPSESWQLLPADSQMEAAAAGRAPCGVWSGVAMPASHLPKECVEYLPVVCVHTRIGSTASADRLRGSWRVFGSVDVLSHIRGQTRAPLGGASERDPRKSAKKGAVTRPQPSWWRCRSYCAVWPVTTKRHHKARCFKPRAVRPAHPCIGEHPRATAPNASRGLARAGPAQLGMRIGRGQGRAAVCRKHE